MKSLKKITPFMMSFALGLIVINHAYAGTAIFDSAKGDFSGFNFIGSTVAPNNDNANPSSNQLYTEFVINSLSPVDLVFEMLDSTATSGATTTEYYFGGQPGPSIITNNSGVFWDRFVIGVGYGNVADGDFQFSTSADFFDLDAPERDPSPTSTAFGVVTHGPNIMLWENGVVNVGNSVGFTFSFDVPDDNSFVPGFAKTQTGFNGAVRFLPLSSSSTSGGPITVVPEPATFALMGLGLVGIFFLKRFKA